MKQGGWRAIALLIGTLAVWCFGAGEASGATLAPTALPALPAAEQEPNGELITASPIASGTRVKAPLHPAGDVDLYRFHAQAGDRVFAAILNLGSPGGSTDSTLTLLDGSGATLESDDDNGSFAGASSSLAGTVVPNDGTYYLGVSDSGAAGATELAYDLYLQLRSAAPIAESEPNGAPGTASSLASGFVSGARSPAGDQDFYAIELSAGDTVFLSLDLDPERDGSTFDGRLGLGPTGDTDNHILLVNDAGASEAPQPTVPSEAFAMTVSNSGTYHAFVDSADAEAGGPAADYQLSATVIPAERPDCGSYPSWFSGSLLDGGGISFPFDVDDTGRIGRAAVRVDLEHAQMVDLDVSLRDPHGVETALFTDIGAAGPGGQTHMEMVFDDYAAVPAAYSVVRPLFSQPEGSRLGWLAGAPAEGEWDLMVRDDNPNGHRGEVSSAELILCPQPVQGVAKQLFRASFEASDEGFTHSGTADEWEWGLPATPANPNSPPVAGLGRCAQGSRCFKTDLNGTYDSDSSQDLVSPPISLAGIGGPVSVSWQQWYQLEEARYDNAFVSVEEADGGNPRGLFTWLGPTMAGFFGNPVVNGNRPAVGGWALHEADISEYAGKTIRLRFHLDSDESAQFAGLAIDDVRVFQPGVPPSPPSPPPIVIAPPARPPAPPHPGTAAVSGFKVKPARFRTARSGGPLLRKRSRSVGTTIELKTVAGARLSFMVYRVVPGRKVRGRCRKAPARATPKPRCARLITIGGFDTVTKTAAVRLPFSGRLLGRPLRPGRYLLEVVAGGGLMTPSEPARTRFHVLRPSPRRFAR